MNRYLATAVIAGLALLGGCEKKVNVSPITEWAQFEDQFFRVTFAYPKGWHKVIEPNKVILYSSQEAMEKFFDPTSNSPIGAQVIIAAERIDTLQEVAKYADGFENDKKNEGYDIKARDHRTVDGVDAVQFTYSGRFDKQTKLTAIRTLLLKDSTFYYVHYGAYNELFEPYKVVYDSVVSSLVLPKPRVSAKNVDPSLPVPELDKFSNEVLDIAYPANFSPSIQKTKGEVAFALEIKGYRQDATINIDVRPAKKLSLEKVAEQNSKNFKSVGPKGSATIGGEKAIYVNYAPAKGIDGRVYFIVKNDKFYRVIVFYPSQMKKEFLPAFEKSVASLRIK